MHAAGRILVQPRAGLPLAELDKIIKAHGGRRLHEIKQINVHIIELPPQANAPAVAAALSKNRHLKFAELDGALKPALYPNDTYYANEWHLPKIGTPTAWDYAQGAGVTIAILDTGVDTSHPDLQSQIVPGWNFYDNNDNVADVLGHGTSVAGIAAAAGNNGAGVAAVSFRSKIMPMRVTDTSGNGFSSLMAQAIIAAADNGARVANISFLGVSLSSTVDSAAQYMRSKGGVVVVSGGNTGALRTDPPRASLTVVAATDSSDVRASFSSWGDYIDIAAPGLGIMTTMRGGGYGSLSGTSAASPVVAGVYALMMSVKPTLQPASLDNILFSSALDLGTNGMDQYFGYGRVRADAAVASARGAPTGDSQPPTVAIASPTGGTVTGLVPVDVTAADNVGVARVELYANNVLKGTDTIAPYGFTLDAAQYTDGPVNLQARAYDAAGNSASSSTVTVTVANDTTAPKVTITNPAYGSVVSGTVSINVAATDNQRVAKIVLSIDGQQVAVTYGASLSYNWTVTTTRKGGRKQSTTTSTIVARAEDPAGNAATATATVTKQ
jgi:subtilisin family serine protease